MTERRTLDFSARFEEWWDPVLTGGSDDSGLTRFLAARVSASRGETLDFEMTYEPPLETSVVHARFAGEGWEATLQDGSRVSGARKDRGLGDRGVSFLLEPTRVLEHSEVVERAVGSDGLEVLELREGEYVEVVDRDGRLVRFEEPRGAWLLLADDVVVGGADTYVATLDAEAGVLRRWDALGGGRLLRRIELVDVTAAPEPG
jgi:hypothetical protein